MGKYSIDAFEQHALVKLRPQSVPMPCKNYVLISLRQSAQDTPCLPQTASPLLLQIILDAAKDLQETAAFIRHVGMQYCGGAALSGVVVDHGTFSGAALHELAAAYIQGFESTVLLSRPDSVFTSVLVQNGAAPGLWLDMSCGILPLRLAVAEHNLQRTWRDRPVYVYNDSPLNEAQLDAAVRWHACGANFPASLGPQLTLRRVMFPQGLTSGGPMPLRMWWQNIGTSPLYQPAEVRLELRCETSTARIVLDGLLSDCPVGDTMLNTTADLPQLPAGEYELWCGLFAKGQPLSVAIDAPCCDGMYPIGALNLDDNPRPYLADMWLQQYADGYYPLEDPAQPE